MLKAWSSLLDPSFQGPGSRQIPSKEYRVGLLDVIMMVEVVNHPDLELITLIDNHGDPR